MPLYPMHRLVARGWLRMGADWHSVTRREVLDANDLADAQDEAEELNRREQEAKYPKK